MTERKRLEIAAKARTTGNLLYRDWWNDDEKLVELLTDLSQKQTIERVAGGRVKLRMQATNFQTPWFFIQHALNRQCALWHDIYFKHFDLIYSCCMNCWKTVITLGYDGDPSKGRIVDLFKLRDLMLKLRLPSKCGIDVRTYTYARYNGFVYGDSPEQGLEYYNIVKDAIDHSDLKRRAKVILKRACTEFEQKYPNSHTWILTPEQVKFEEKLDSIFAPVPDVEIGAQIGLSQNHVFRIWLDYAYQICDPTWKDALEYEGYTVPPEGIYPKPVEYHEMTAEEIYQKLEDGINQRLVKEAEDGLHSNSHA
jgi:hypothetical protein